MNADNVQNAGADARAPAKAATTTQGSVRPITRSRPFRVGLVLVAALTAGLVCANFLPAQMAITVGLTLFCVILWASGLVPEYWTAFFFFFTAAIVAGLAPPATVFSGFHASSFWLFFGGLVLGAAIRHTGANRRMAGLLSRSVGQSYSGMIAGIALFSLGLAFVVPSAMGRVVLLLPIVAALADAVGYGPGRNGRTAMLLAATFGTFLPAFTILPANTPNMILTGMMESLYDTHVSYGEYLLLHFPVLGALKLVLMVPLILKLYPDRMPDAAVLETNAPLPPASASERRLALLMASCLGLWLTDSLHHVSPGWIALGAAVICLWPGSGLTSPKCLSEDISYGGLFFVAGIIGLGAVIGASGLGARLVGTLTEAASFSTDAPARNVALLAGISTLVATATNLPGVPAVMTPLAEKISGATGLPLVTVLMTQVLAFSNVLLPYQAPPLISAIQIGNIPGRAVTRICLVLFVLTLVILLPLDLLWWHLLGRL